MKRQENGSYIHETAYLYGLYSIGNKSSIWPYVVMRSEDHSIEIGECTNIQDGVIIHTGYKDPVKIGNNCTIGHMALIHGATVGNNCIIGSGAMLLDGCIIEDGVVIEAGRIVLEGEVVENTSEKAKEISIKNEFLAKLYYENSVAYSKENYRLWAEPDFKKEKLKMLKQMLSKAQVTKKLKEPQY